ncbi:MAG: membrane-bound lytic murein transglycosylase MltF [Robiginitomaculum sp.]|nr:membrane-bound lytic murein transglycosylase MltF [Robiginitomaculum sp.]MDQ7078276.1 membrane-bound lytic murein transglycosylase MltF [Robiginitomaculum sp.]
MDCSLACTHKNPSTLLLSRALKLTMILLVFGLGACGTERHHQGSILREAQNRGVLRVVTLNSPTTYYEDREGPAGFEYDLANAYAAHLGLELQMETAPTIEAVLNAVIQDKADFAAAGLTITPERQRIFRFGPSYLQVQTRLVCGRRGPKPKTLEDLVTVDLRVAPGSAYVEVLTDLQKQQPEIQYKISENVSVENLLGQIGNGKKFCTLADSYVFDLNRRYLPELTSPMTLSDAQPIAWALGGGLSWRPISLERNMKAWFARKETGALLEILKERYFQVADNDFDYVDLARFRRAIRGRLPVFRPLFEKAGKRYKLPWELLAAISWRESHWRPNARSHTGVRGMMMLTRTSAREAGVTNRLDPAQSIKGGARYFARLLRRLPSSITGEDRIWFVLAAYNMGYAHMMDARTLATRRGLNPNLWRDVREVLMDMEDPKTYKTLPRGYANGLQARDYVAAVRNFYDILRQNTQKSMAQ